MSTGASSAVHTPEELYLVSAERKRCQAVVLQTLRTLVNQNQQIGVCFSTAVLLLASNLPT